MWNRPPSPRLIVEEDATFEPFSHKAASASGVTALAAVVPVRTSVVDAVLRPLPSSVVTRPEREARPVSIPSNSASRRELTIFSWRCGSFSQSKRWLKASPLNGIDPPFRVRPPMLPSFLNRAKVRAVLWEFVKLRHSLRRTARFDASLSIDYRKETKIELSEAGAARPFVKTFRYDGRGINGYHCALADAPVGRMGVPFCIDIGIDGYLARAEAMKLYELAYFTDGDILELGTFRGLSASIFARSLEDRGSSGQIDTCDIDQTSSDLARQRISSLPGADRVTFHVNDAAILMDELRTAGRKFGILFIDHWHGYDATRAALERTPSILRSGGFVIMHDYNDPCTLLPEHPHKVFQAVHDTIGVDPRFEFVCIVASMAVYRKKAD